jgi:hypothetical protein
VLLVQNFQDYKNEHIGEHHSVHYMTLRDPTVKALLIGLGLRAGMPRLMLWHQLLRSLVSPKFQLDFIIARVRSHFLPASPAQRVVSVSFLIVLGLLVTATHSWIAFLIAWVLPLTLFFQITTTLRLCVKHVFPPPGGNKRGKDYFASLTYGVFLGERVPDSHLPIFQEVWAWLGWFARMTLIHFPTRFLVLVADTVCHDYHHRHPKAKNWANYIFARQEDIISGHPGWPPIRKSGPWWEQST